MKVSLFPNTNVVQRGSPVGTIGTDGSIGTCGTLPSTSGGVIGTSGMASTDWHVYDDIFSVYNPVNF